MAGQKPPPRTLDPQEEQKIQRFLERAAPLVLESPELNSARWHQLSVLAEELQLTPEQLRHTLQELCERGVLKTVELPAPKPPPRPSRLEPDGTSQPWQNAPDSNFSLTPPPARGTQLPRRKPEIQVPLSEARHLEPESEQRRAPPVELPVDASAPSLPPGFGERSPKASPAEPQEILPVALSDPAAGDRDIAGRERRRRWRWEGEDDPLPPPPRKEPAATFRDYVRTAFEQSRERALSAEREQELVRHGVAALGLASVYARDLVTEVAIEMDFPRATDSPVAEDAHNERLAAFGEFVAGSLARLTPPVLTANVEQTLAEQGRMFFGIRADRVPEVIRDTARERKLPVISRELAEEKLRALITELLGDGVRLPRDARGRVEAEGKQWGLALPDIESAIHELIQAKHVEQTWERRFTNLALLAASFAVLLLVSFLAWAVLESHLGGKPNSAGRAVPPPKRPLPRSSDRDDSGWDVPLSAILEQTRMDSPQLSPSLLAVRVIAPRITTEELTAAAASSAFLRSR